MDVTCLSSTQNLVYADTSHNDSLNESMLLSGSRSVVNTTCNDSILLSTGSVVNATSTADELPPYQYQEMFNMDHVSLNDPVSVIHRSASMSEGGRVANHRRRLVAQRASQLAASLSRQ